MNARHFAMSWNDLSFQKQQELIAEISIELRTQYKTQGEEAMKKVWHVAPKTWEEAFCRENAVDHSIWNGLIETCDEFQNFDWLQSLIEHSETQAEKLIAAGVRLLELEVQV